MIIVSSTSLRRENVPVTGGPSRATHHAQRPAFTGLLRAVPAGPKVLIAGLVLAAVVVLVVGVLLVKSVQIGPLFVAGRPAPPASSSPAAPPASAAPSATGTPVTADPIPTVEPGQGWDPGPGPVSTRPVSSHTTTKATPAQPRPPVTAPTTALPGGVLVSRQSSRCLAAVDNADGQPLTVRPCDGSPTQHWQTAADGTIRMGPFCMDAAWGATDDGTTVQIAWCNGLDAQQFSLLPTGDLLGRASNKCVDVRRARDEPAVTLMPCTGRPNQRWSWQPQ
jgi:hypothetical protein